MAHSIRGWDEPDHAPSRAEISATRRLIGITVDQLGDVLKINPRTIRGWESGKFTPSPNVVSDLDQLRARQDQDTQAALKTARAGKTVVLDDGPMPAAWYLAVGARVLAEIPDARLEYAVDNDAPGRTAS